MAISSALAALAALAFLALPHTSRATVGVDVSQRTSTSAFQCLKRAGFEFAVVRCYQSVGRPDPACAASVKSAWEAGMAHVDVYMFPDPTAGNPAGQVKAMVDALSAAGISKNGKPPNSFGMVWLDIEGSQYWHSDKATNQAFFSGLAAELENLGQHIGVYTSASQWGPIMGEWTGGAKYPLWYAHYDNAKTFGDFGDFGGWSRPAMKQYAGDATVCGVGIDESWYPSAMELSRNASIRG